MITNMNWKMNKTRDIEMRKINKPKDLTENKYYEIEEQYYKEDIRNSQKKQHEKNIRKINKR
jgi:hypothetical protein